MVLQAIPGVIGQPHYHKERLPPVSLKDSSRNGNGLGDVKCLFVDYNFYWPSFISLFPSVYTSNVLTVQYSTEMSVASQQGGRRSTIIPILQSDSRGYSSNTLDENIEYGIREHEYCDTSSSRLLSVLARICRPRVALALAFTFTPHHLTALTCLPHTHTHQPNISPHITPFPRLHPIKSAPSEMLVQGFEQPWGHLPKRSKRAPVRIWTKPMTL